MMWPPRNRFRGTPVANPDNFGISVNEPGIRHIIIFEVVWDDVATLEPVSRNTGGQSGYLRSIRKWT